MPSFPSAPLLRIKYRCVLGKWPLWTMSDLGSGIHVLWSHKTKGTGNLTPWSVIPILYFFFLLLAAHYIMLTKEQ